MTPEQIAESRARCEKATEGPWRELDYAPECIAAEDGTVVAEMPGMECLMGRAAWYRNLPFIAHARTDLPAALDALEAERKRVAELEAENEKLWKKYEQQRIRSMELEAENARLRAVLEAEVVCPTCEGTGIMGGECECVLAFDRPSATCLLCGGKGSWEDTCAECEGRTRSYRTEAAKAALEEGR